MPRRPAGFPSIATKTTVCPSERSASALSRSAPGSTPISARSAALPTATSLPSTVPRTPFPVTLLNSAERGSAKPRDSAPSRIAAARGCSLSRSRPAAYVKSIGSFPSRAIAATSLGFPSVKVPVLSTTSVSTFSRTSMASAFRKRIPIEAPRPAATMIDIGVASPRAQGQAMMSTATAFRSAYAIRGSGPTRFQIRNVATATATTAGTK